MKCYEAKLHHNLFGIRWFKQWLRSAGNKNHSPLHTLFTSSLCCLHLSRKRVGVQRLHLKKKDQPKQGSQHFAVWFFWGEPTACWALIKVITAWSLLRALISNPKPVWKLQCMGCHQHPAESLVILACQTETGGRGGAGGFSSLKRENFGADSLANLKQAAELYHTGYFFTPRL